MRKNLHVSSLLKGGRGKKTLAIGLDVHKARGCLDSETNKPRPQAAHKDDEERKGLHGS